MIPFNTLLQHGLLYGAILSVSLSALILISLYFWPMVWIGDAHKDVQAIAPPMTATDRRIKAILGVVFFGLLIGAIVAALVTLRNLGGGSLTFADAFWATFIIFQTFNLVDLLFIDWLIVEWWRPSFIAFPGSEGLNMAVGYGYHFRGFLKGTVMGLAAGVVVGVVVVLIQ